jgi:SNF2 family DNA or RNA helicase
LIINALTRLRQIACHPAMINPETMAGSGKLDAITQNLSVLIKEQHKILVISSYVKHLKLVGAWMDEQSIPYTELTGKTTNHEEVVNQFKTMQHIRVMLMTLKKGGYGLNLTEADYVLIIDPWWNPAAQQQGMDRVYRIGQDKPVFVYKFITVGTVEEKILQMQRDKKRIADTLIHTSNPLDYLPSERLMQLLEDQPKP